MTPDPDPTKTNPAEREIAAMYREILTSSNKSECRKIDEFMTRVLDEMRPVDDQSWKAVVERARQRLRDLSFPLPSSRSIYEVKVPAPEPIESLVKTSGINQIERNLGAFIEPVGTPGVRHTTGPGAKVPGSFKRRRK